MTTRHQMIPDHLIDKAAQAIVTGMGSKSRLADMHPEDAAYARADARAALEAVAADIWDAATEAQASWEWLAERGREGDIPSPQDNNPYRASETA